MNKFLLSSLALSIVLSILFLVQPVSAFSVFNEMPYAEVCAGSFVVVSNVITGAGNYNIITSGTASSFTKYTVPSEFSIVEGSKTVSSYVKPISTTPVGKYELIVKVGSGGEIKESLQEVIVKDCHLTTLVSKDQITCPCEKASFPLTITNQGEFDEIYDIDVNYIKGQIVKGVSLSNSTLSLEPKQTEEIFAYVDAPCDIIGDYELIFEAKAKTSTAKATAKAILSIKPCYEYTLSIPKSNYEICENEELTIPLIIKNQGTSNNNYKINLYAPKWAILEKKELLVNAGQEITINILVSPPYKTDGNFTVKAETLTDYGAVKKSVETNINVKKCYGVLVDIEKEEDKICNGMDKSYKVNIKNTGKSQNTYDININIPWATTSQDKITLESDAEKQLTLVVAPPIGTIAKTYSIDIIASDPISKEGNNDIINIEAITKEKCLKTEISTEETTVEVIIDKDVIILLIIENKGIETVSYFINITGNAASFSQINPDKLTLKPGEAEAIYLYTAPPIQTEIGTYEVTVTIATKEMTNLASKTIKINVKESEEGNEKENITETTEKNMGIEEVLKTQISVLEKIKDFFINIFKGSKLNEDEMLQNLTNENLTVGDITGLIIEGIDEEGLDEQNKDKTENKINFGGFFNEYKSYVVGAISIVLITMIFITFWKKILNFFEEEEKTEKEKK